jgi:predicted nuclease of predicted toxin-antitoxin system
MNLSPRCKAPLEAAGHEVEHWFEVGAVNATDSDIMAYARNNAMVVVTHDLDFAVILLTTRADRPSVNQIRGHRLETEYTAVLICAALRECREPLERVLW